VKKKSIHSFNRKQAGVKREAFIMAYMMEWDDYFTKRGYEMRVVDY